jgi:hypothetical protein
LEQIRVNSYGRYLRVFFENSDRRPAARFSVFELRVLPVSRYGGGYGGGGGYGRDDRDGRYGGRR